MIPMPTLLCMGLFSRFWLEGVETPALQRRPRGASAFAGASVWGAQVAA